MGDDLVCKGACKTDFSKMIGVYACIVGFPVHENPTQNTRPTENVNGATVQTKTDKCGKMAMRATILVRYTRTKSIGFKDWLWNTKFKSFRINFITATTDWPIINFRRQWTAFITMGVVHHVLARPNEVSLPFCVCVSFRPRHCGVGVA